MRGYGGGGGERKITHKNYVEYLCSHGSFLSYLHKFGFAMSPNLRLKTKGRIKFGKFKVSSSEKQ